MEQVMNLDNKEKVKELYNFLVYCTKTERNFFVTFCINNYGHSTHYFNGKATYIHFHEFDIIDIKKNNHQISIELDNIETITHTIDENNKNLFFIAFKDKMGYASISEE
jgi:hypothetical protein